ncbi:MAG: hypothetical protein ACRDPB_01370 [Nocardioidaceae bacterium]
MSTGLDASQMLDLASVTIADRRRLAQDRANRRIARRTRPRRIGYTRVR